MIKKLLKLFPILIILTVFLSLSEPLVSPSLIQANPPADVFTGQIIPAFIGNEYDPTLAFQELAGATVYVFAYDNWDAAAADQIVVGNKAIKTQIRADGTFQAMGLPHATYYGIYFPYGQNGPIEPRDGSGNRKSYECPVIANLWCTLGPGTEVYPVPNTDPQDYCCVLPVQTIGAIKNTAFRIPEPNDNIADVFGYAQAIYNGTTLIPTQIAEEFVKPLGQPIFVTSNNKLDIENHINVFPVVPTSVLKIKINTTKYGVTAENSTSDPLAMGYSIAHQPIEVSATRIGYYRPAYSITESSVGSPYLPTSGPTITGKTDQNGYFKVYAPSGYYQITYKLNDNVNLAFQEVDAIGEDPVPVDGDSRDNLKLLSQWKTDSANPGDPSNPDDWYIYRGGTHIWGIVQIPYQTSLQSQAQQNIPLSKENPFPPDYNYFSGYGSFYHYAPDLALYIETEPYVKNDGGNIIKVQKFFEGVNIGNNQGQVTGDGSFWDPCNANPNKCNFTRPNKFGIFYLRTSETISFVNGYVKLVKYDQAGDIVDPHNAAEYPCSTRPCPDPMKIIEKPLDGPTQGAYMYDFVAEKAQVEGLMINVQDKNQLPAGDALVTFSPVKADLKLKSPAATQNLSFRTNQKDGSLFVSPLIFAENSELMDAGNCMSPDNPIPEEGYSVVVSKGDSFKASTTITKETICNSISTPTEIPISTRNKPNNVNEPGLITLAKSLQLGDLISVRAEDEESQCSIYDPVDGRIEPLSPTDPESENHATVMIEHGIRDIDPVPFIPIYASFNSQVNAPAMVAVADIAGNVVPREIIKLKGGETLSDTTFDKYGGLSGSGAAFYDPNTNRLLIAFPCMVGAYSIKIETGDSINLGSQGLGIYETTFIERVARQISFLVELVKAGFSAVQSGLSKIPGGEESFDYDFGGAVAQAWNDNMRVIFDTNIYSDSKYIDIQKRFFTTGNTNFDLIEISVEEDTAATGATANYIVNPPSMFFALQTQCHGFDILNLGGTVPCLIAEKINNGLEGILGFLEKFVLHTPSVSEYPTITYMWNLFRTIANGFIIIITLIFALMYMFRYDSKEFPIQQIPFKLVKAILFINLSLLYCQLFIDIANVATRAIWVSVERGVTSQLASGGLQSGISSLTGFGAVIGAILFSAFVSGVSAGAGVVSATVASGGTFAVALLAGLGMLILTFVIGIFAIFAIIMIQFVVRITIIYLCTITAPIRFLLTLLPAGEGFTKLWDGIFYSFVFMQTIAALFLIVGVSIINTIPVDAGTGIQLMQLAIGVAIGYITIKSPSLLLGLLGGGGMAGKLMGGASEGLGEIQGKAMGGIKEHYASELIAERGGRQAAMEEHLVGKKPVKPPKPSLFAKKEVKEQYKKDTTAYQGERKAYQDRYKALSGKDKLRLAGGKLEALTGATLPGTKLKRARQRGEMAGVEAMMHPIRQAAAEQAMDQSKKDSEVVNSTHSPISTAVRSQAKEMGYRGDSGIAQFYRDTTGAYLTLGKGDQLTLDTVKVDSKGTVTGSTIDPTTGESFHSLVQGYNKDAVENLTDEDIHGSLSSQTQGGYERYSLLTQKAIDEKPELFDKLLPSNFEELARLIKEGNQSEKEIAGQQLAAIQNIARNDPKMTPMRQEIAENRGRLITTPTMLNPNIALNGEQVRSFSRFVAEKKAGTAGIQKLSSIASTGDYDVAGAWAQKAFEEPKLIGQHNRNNVDLRLKKQRQQAQPMARPTDDYYRMRGMTADFERKS